MGFYRLQMNFVVVFGSFSVLVLKLLFSRSDLKSFMFMLKLVRPRKYISSPIFQSGFTSFL